MLQSQLRAGHRSRLQKLTEGDVSSMESNGRQKVLITGGAGVLGINLIRRLMAKGYAIASLDVEEFDYPEGHKIETTKGDIRDKEGWHRGGGGGDRGRPPRR